MAEYKFDVAPSFAEEDRDRVLPIVERLKDLGVNLFYDRDREVEMWGRDRVEYFSETFSHHARFVLLFSSQNYVSKWTRLQSRAAMARALEEHTEYVLPIRLDDTPVPGLLPTIAYLDMRRHSVEVIAQAVVEKLAQHRASFTPSTPITSKSVAALAREKPRGWEYLLYVTVVSQGLAELESKYWEHFIRYAPRNGDVEHGNGIDLIRDRNVLLSEIIKVAVDAVFTSDTQEAAFGLPGAPGNPDRIVHLGKLFVRTFDEILEWGRGIHGTSYANASARVAAHLQARFADQQLLAMYKVATDLREVADTLVERLTAGEQINITVPLVFEVDPGIEQEFAQAIRQLTDA